MIWPCLKVFWFSKDNPTAQSERKKVKEVDIRNGRKTILKSGQEWTFLAQLRQLETGQGELGFSRIHLWCLMTFQGYGIAQNMYIRY